MILGTAGHVDHGKTALVKALTGVDTDRLAEEKRRGITIDLGFAPLKLEGGLTVGVVDVPGHEAFVRNMLAGATGVDLALLVIAADEGVMPQTREHVAILQLLGLRAGVVALTKSDLADDEWMDLVSEDVRATVANSPLAAAPIVRTSVVNGHGLDALRAAIDVAARALPAREADDLFRLPVDRAFSVRGTGTVVTGTVWTGSIGRDTPVRILPSGRIARVRGIESHGAPVDRALPGMRAAIALAGVEAADVPRGVVLVADDAWHPTRMLLADVGLLRDVARSLGPRARVRFHLGTAEVGARVITAGGALSPGERKPARIVLDEPVVARAGDRFVLRSGSPLTTVGGGIVCDPLPPHRRSRPWTDGWSSSVSARLGVALQRAGAHGVSLRSLPVRLGEHPARLRALLQSADGSTGEEATRLGDRLIATDALETLAARILALVDDYHLRAPLEPGVPLQMLRSQLPADAAVVDATLQGIVARGELETEASLVKRRGWQPRLTASQLRTRTDLLTALESAGREPPSVAELAARYGPDTPGLLRLAERDGRIIQVEPERYFSRQTVETLSAALRDGMAAGREYSPSELRDLLGFSRKFLIPFLEYCDRHHLTERRASGRVRIGA